MQERRTHRRNRWVKRLLPFFLVVLLPLCSMAQTDSIRTTTEVLPDSIGRMLERLDSIVAADSTLLKDSTESVLLTSSRKIKEKRDWSTWRPNPQRALWLALVLPGAGQIYNRKYWKLPIIYGGFMGCIYALSWNNMMYKDYSQAYLDIMDNDPGTASYNKFLHLGVKIDGSNMERYKQIFKSRKDKYRRWRDMSIIAMVAVYALSVLDAYVDAELSEFDISKDLSLRVTPTIMNNQSQNRSWQAQTLGVSCSLNF